MKDSSPKPRDEKDEKQHEKEEKGRSDPLSTAVWGAIIVWAGLVFLAENLGLFAAFRTRSTDAPRIPFLRLEAWGLIFVGAGLIVLLEAAIRFYVPDYRRGVAGNVILGIVFLAIGLGNLISWNIIWPLALIAIGVLVLIRGTGWRR